MAHYLWLGLRQQRGRTLLASVGFLVAACALLLLSAATQATVFRTTQLISLHWRPTYDLVVVPAHQAVPSPGSSIPPDQFEGYTGRISMQQYAEIQHLPGVSVAAPIAFISYVQYPMSTIDFGSYPPGFYQLSWTLTASNGQRSIVEYQTTTIVYAFKGHCPPTLAGRFCQPLTQKQFAPLQAIGVGDYFYSADTYFTGVPNPGAFLLASLGYVILTMQALLVAQRGEFAILSALGWRSWHLATLLLGQALILAPSGGLVGSGLALLLCKLLGLSPPTALIVWTLPAMLGLALLGVLAPSGASGDCSRLLCCAVAA